MLSGRDVHDVVPIVFDFLGVRDPDRALPTMDPEVRKGTLLASVRHLVQARSAREPILIFVDDAHWIDSGSDEFLAQVVEAAGGTRTLVLVNFRPEYHAEWTAKSYYRQVPLGPLGPDARRELVEDLIGRHPSVASLPDLIHQRTGGNPFFSEEVARSLVESGALESSSNNRGRRRGASWMLPLAWGRRPSAWLRAAAHWSGPTSQRLRYAPLLAESRP